MIEAALSVAIISMILGSCLVFMLKVQEIQQQIVTDRNVQMVIASMGGFVSRNGRLPYPSLPNMNGDEFEHPEDDREWRENPQKYTRGTIPWRTLGISEYYCRDGRGNYYTYLVDPTLCGRKSIESVPMGSAREYVDSENNYSRLGFFNRLQEGLELVSGDAEKLVDGDQISESKKVQIGRYSSYRAVRSYLEDCGYSGEGMTKCWDIASKIKESKLVAYKDGRKIEHNRESFLILKDQQWLEVGKLAKQAISLVDIEIKASNMFISIANDLMQEEGQVGDEDSPYRVDNFIAFAIISHKDNLACFGSKEPSSEAPNSNKHKDNPNVFHVNDNNSAGDRIVWMTRFEFADMHTNCKCAGFKIMML